MFKNLFTKKPPQHIDLDMIIDNWQMRVEILRYREEIRKLNSAIHRKNYTIEQLKSKVRKGDTTLRGDILNAKKKAVKTTKTKKVKTV